VDDLGETLEFMRLLWAVDHALQRTSRQMDKTLGVTGPQRLAIRVLARRPGLSAGEVARTLRIHPSTLTEILKRLELRTIIRREQDPRDARRASLYLNGLGETLNKARAGTIEDSVERALAKLPAAQIRAARSVLETLVAELEARLPADRAMAERPSRATGRG
jgi:DNA-binding MarR family transcriptional regulator